jgi:hypothetical protein
MMNQLAWEPHSGQEAIPAYFSQSNLIKSNVKVVNFGRLMLRIVDEQKVTPRYIFDQLALNCPILTCDIFLTSCRTRLNLPKRLFSDKDLRDTFALMNREKNTVNSREFHSFLILVQRLDEPRRSNTVSKLARAVTSSMSSSIEVALKPPNSCNEKSLSSSQSHQQKSKVSQLNKNTVAINENFKIDFRYTLNGIQLFTIPYYGNWRILARGAYGGNVAMQHGGKPAECCACIDTLEPGQTLIIAVGEGGHMGGGGGASFVALLDKGVSITDFEKYATLLLIMGGGGGAGFCDGVEATCSKTSMKGLHAEKATEEVKSKGGSNGKGLNSKTLKNGTKIVSIKSILSFVKKQRYGGLVGGGDAADAFSLTCPKSGPVLSPTEFTFLAGGGGGGGYRGGEGGTIGGGGGSSYIDTRAMKQVDFFRVVTSERDEKENLAGNGFVELSIDQRIYKASHIVE